MKTTLFACLRAACVFTISLFTILPNALTASNTGSLQGKVTDKKTGEGIPFATVVVQKDSSQKNTIPFINKNPGWTFGGLARGAGMQGCSPAI